MTPLKNDARNNLKSSCTMMSIDLVNSAMSEHEMADGGIQINNVPEIQTCRRLKGPGAYLKKTRR